jgi:uncharacterized repeat protein (TIGR01451 family)
MSLGIGRFARLVTRTLLVVAVAVFGLVAVATSAGATLPQAVVPSVKWVCASGANNVAQFSYNNPNANTVNLTDKRDGGDHDSDDNFFTPNPGDRGQQTAFAPGTHDLTTSPTNGPISYPGNSTLTWTLQTSSVATAAGPANCPDDLSVESITDAAQSATITAGAADSYTIVAKNNGPYDATGVTVVDALTLPSGTTFPTASSTLGTCSSVAPNVTCTIGTLTPGQSVTITMSITPATTGTLQHSATISSLAVADTNPSNNNKVLNQTVGAQGGPAGGGIFNAGQSLTVADTKVNGVVTVQNGTVPLSASVTPCPTGMTCNSEVLNVLPHATQPGQTLTAVFDTGKPSPFILIPFVKFFYFKDDLVVHPLPLCPRYLKPIPPADGSPCEYFRWMNLQGANDPHLRR